MPDVVLQAVVRHYIDRHRPRSQAELAAFREAATLEAAVRRAGRAENAAGRRDPHHTRRSREVLDRAEARLVERLPDIARAPDFARLLDVVRKAVGHFEGLGPLYLYDTALRIGAKKGTLPTRVYLHAGTRAGARKLKLDVQGRKALDRSDLPPEFADLQMYEIEDVLCIYKDHFDAGSDLDAAPVCWPEEESKPSRAG